MVGEKYGKRTIISDEVRIIGGNYLVLTRCDCGKEKWVNKAHILGGQYLQCASCSKKGSNNHQFIHGLEGSRLYRIWKNMKTRCTNKNHEEYHRYGGRGISICEEWLHSFEAFASWALSHGYESEKEIDRIDNNGNYEPENCRFATRKTNTRNRTTNRIIHAFGTSKSLSEWADDGRCKVKYQALAFRIRSGWNPELAIITESCLRRQPCP